MSLLNVLLLILYQMTSCADSKSIQVGERQIDLHQRYYVGHLLSLFLSVKSLRASPHAAQ